ncbi:uncharacterized protein F5891DRAFT_1127250 [Suillus fuscotomentosus]|uniref:Uncharacterized protein n=1 Tax=Suillus fuscotomentosus TaxID=1912939 RepID=A0AAD4EBW1_9AGAM|nr:uncharacterized protein F5891DRAFT_1127250 [Suillus fuscotomentosus]KAG1903415.1 hypothetical protein F5891DRAFT_1127250 [Suillus fuscotomentosus]
MLLLLTFVDTNTAVGKPLRTCKSLRLFTLTRPVYRQLAHDLLARSRPLPLHSFQRLSDLSTPALIAAVDRARGFEKAVPSHEEIDWLSPITSSYTLCATKSGRVLCWDVRRDICLAEWDPRSLACSGGGDEDEDEDDEDKWELWKCRVEFEERTVYFTMARVLKGYHDDRPPPPPPVSTIPIPESARPVFDKLTSFHTTGVIMNVFLLDPPRRLLSAFVWIASSNTIGLYVLLDWAKDDYVFVDTGVGCLISSNWSCILHEDQIVIHSEEADAAYQHFYPLEVLRTYGRPRCIASPATHAQTQPQAEEGTLQENNGEDIPDSLKSLWNKLPTICARLTPSRSISKKFVFPSVPGTSGAVIGMPPVGDEDEEDTEEEDEVSAAEEDQGQTENNTEPVSEEEQTGANEVSSTVPSVEDEQSVGHEEPVDEEEPPDDEEEFEDTHEGEEEMPFAPKRTGERRTRFEDEETGNDSSADGPSSSQGGATTSESFTNPYPFPPWYPESAHFVRQWWPTLPGVPRLSCTVVLLAAHDPETHRTRFVLAQHYFKVPITPEGLPVVGESSTSSSSRSAQANDDDMLHLWYVSTPFEVVCVLEEGDDDEDTGDRPRPLVAVDFGHAVWVEYGSSVVPPTLNNDHLHPHPRRRVPKCLRFVTFPPVHGRRERTEEAVVRTLEIPEELDLDVVETINIDQSQGAVILSVRDGKIFILRYE